jgi:hypothetical protein
MSVGRREPSRVTPRTDPDRAATELDDEKTKAVTAEYHLSPNRTGTPVKFGAPGATDRGCAPALTGLPFQGTDL